MLHSKSDKPPSYTEAMNSGYSVTITSPPIGNIYSDGNTYQQQQPTAPPIHNQPSPNYVQPYGTINPPPQVVAVTVPNDIIVIGGCPSCRIGFLEDSYPCGAVFLAIFFFPIGLLCCLALKNRRCSNCGAEF